jgi:hypothetical protein
LEAEIERLQKLNLPEIPDLNPVLAKPKPKSKVEKEKVLELNETGPVDKTKAKVTIGTQNTISAIKKLMRIDYNN